jgi:UTP--glucose-1-phosphate uridylyltransferase
MRLTQAILPVAGLGTRFLPWTKVVPKELLPLGNQPIVAHLVDECLSIGITDICFVINRGKESLPQYFFANPALERELQRRGKSSALEQLKRYDAVNLHVVYQVEPLGDGHAILQAADWVKSETVAILFGDDLIIGKETGLQQLVKAKESTPSADAMLCLEDVGRERVEKYGIVDVDLAGSSGRLKKIRGLIEKPTPDAAPSTLAIVGKYLIPKSTFGVLRQIPSDNETEIRLIDALIRQLSDIGIYGYECEGTRLDTGTPEGYREAVKIMG